jgi:PHD/YefM family antitoxin component YafN of YafNO toxin-antitoxin module
MLSRKILKSLQIASGLSPEAVVQRTGIPYESLTALLAENGKDPQSLIGEATYQRVLATLGISPEFNGLRQHMVVPWRCGPSDRKGNSQWLEAIALLRPEMLSKQLTVVEVLGQKRFFGRQAAIMLVHDAEFDLRLAVVGASVAARRQLVAILGSGSARSVAVSNAEFSSMTEQIDRAVFGSVRFDDLMGGQLRKYDWADVKASAQEFNFQTDDIIALILEEVKRRNERSRQAETSAQNSTIVPFAANGG